jgi:thiosulfate reductase cytochrome b subunit
MLDSPRHSGVVRITHWLTALGFFGLLVSGFAILLAHPRLYWGQTGSVGTPSLIDLPLPFMLGGQSGWGRYLHFLSAWICVLTGVLYVLWGLLTQHFRKDLLPARAGLKHALSSHLRLTRAARESSETYNPLQRLTYLAVIFVLFPLMIWTGFAMSPAITSVFPGLVTICGGHQSARTIHFFAASLLVLFLAVHVGMVWLAGFRERVGSMIVNFSPTPSRTGLTSRRKVITTGVATAAGASALVAGTRLASRYGLIPPDHGGIYGIGETLTYASQHLLISHHSLAREFERSEISKVFPVNGPPPENDAYQRLLAGRFADWRLQVDGLVARPSSFSLADLRRLPARSQITQHTCEEGWSCVAEWTGVPVSHLLNLVGALPQARYVVFFPFDQFWDSLDMPDALHPQTLLAYGMNGGDLPTGHGAPLRLRVARQLGYKSVKYLSRITVTDTLKNIGTGLGSASPDVGYSWYAGI